MAAVTGDGVGQETTRPPCKETPLTTSIGGPSLMTRPPTMSKPSNSAWAAATSGRHQPRGGGGRRVWLRLGEKTCDVYLNGAAYWRKVPMNVWEYYIGGYQVIRKWLSYREIGFLGRALKPGEAREVMNMARRIAAVILLQPRLDENYRAVKATAFDWSSQ